MNRALYCAGSKFQREAITIADRKTGSAGNENARP
jgi:hypothetical protein